MQISLYQIDAFTSRLFGGNPAAVCPLKEWLDDGLLQAIAQENNLSETAFFVPVGDGYHIRWFTPVTEVNLCGHGTLASAFVIFTYLDPSRQRVSFESRSGTLTVTKEGDLLSMDFPSQPPAPCAVPEGLVEGLGKSPIEILAAEDYLVRYESPRDVAGLAPKFDRLRGLPLRGVITTAPGDHEDFVSRWFGPNVGVNEDPVTGSAHCTLTPYWAQRLGKTRLHARQISSRGGELVCELGGDRVFLTGAARLFLRGEIVL